MELTKKELEMLSDAVLAKIGSANEAYRLIAPDAVCKSAIEDLRRRWQDLGEKICEELDRKVKEEEE